MNLPKKGLSVSPNPFKDEVYLFLPTDGGIYTITGQLINTLKSGKHKIDTKNWEVGVYLIKCGNDVKRMLKLSN